MDIKPSCCSSEMLTATGNSLRPGLDKIVFARSGWDRLAFYSGSVDGSRFFIDT
jgi:hypothetical protein